MYANALAAERREMPRDDIVSTLLDAEVDGDRLSEMDFNLFFLLIAVAGNETTRNSISHGIRAFCDNPDQYQLLVKDPTLARSATEEIVRWASPVMYFRRNVTKDTELGGQQLEGRRQGQHLVRRARTATKTCSTTRSRSTSAAHRTSTSASAAAARTTASAPTSPAWRSTCCSRRWPAGSRPSSSPARCSRSAPTSSAASSTCP